MNITEFIIKLQESGYKLTKQRQMVWEIILKNMGQHLNTEEIFNEAHKKSPKIGVATIYRTLQLFEKIGLVQHISLDGGRRRYQISNPEEKHDHHHLICQICGEVIDGKEDMLDFCEENIFLKEEFRVTNYSINFFGICKRCLYNLEEKKNGENSKERY